MCAIRFVFFFFLLAGFHLSICFFSLMSVVESEELFHYNFQWLENAPKLGFRGHCCL